MPDPAGGSDKLCMEVLKTLGKSLSFMNLYNGEHPAVKAMLAEAVNLLARILEESPGGEIVYSIDGGKVLANGRIVGSSSEVPNSVANAFSRFRLTSLAFQRGTTVDDLKALCLLAASRPGAEPSAQPAAFLKDKGVSRIVLNEARYAKVDPGSGKEPPPAPAAGPDAAASGQVSRAVARLSEEPLENTIEVLVKNATPDPEEQRKLFDIVMQRLRSELKEKVDEATRVVRKQATVLRNEQVRTEAVIMNMAEGVVVVDEGGRVLMMNAAAEEIYGASLAELAGKPLLEHAGEEHLVTLSKEARVPDDKLATGEVAVKAREETLRTLRASSAVVQTEGGKPVGMVATLTEVAKFRELQKMQKEFVAHVTHELRAPLTAIRAALEILDGAFSGKLSEDERRVMANALRNTDRLEDLVNQILDFSKIESGQMTVYPKSCDPGTILREAADSVKPWAMKKSMRLEVEVEPKLPPVFADHKRTVQVLINLLSNAIKFTPAGGRILVQAKTGGEQEPVILFSVSDSGPGIAKADQQSIFQKFVQIASGEKHLGGTGLGLAIAKALVHLQKGRLWVESEVGKGASFSFTLPRSAKPEEAPPQARGAAPQPWWKRLLG
jgi:PAS domain S-box-containing protein